MGRTKNHDLKAGTLVKRAGHYYLRIMVQGRLVCRALGATSRRQALRKASAMVGPLIGGDPDTKAAALEQLVASGRTYRRRPTDADPDFAPVERPASTSASASNGPHLLQGISLHEAWGMFTVSGLRRACSPETLKDYDSMWSCFVAWVEKHHPDVQDLRDLTLSITQQYQHALSGLSANRQNKRILLCRMLVGVIIKQKHVEAMEAASRSGTAVEIKTPPNPFSYLSARPKTEQGRRELTVAELSRVCGSAVGELQMAFAVGLFTCLRLVDVCTLRWDEVDLQTGEIVRIPRKTRLRTGKAVVVRIHPVLKRFLLAVPEDQRYEYVLPGLASRYLHNRSQVSREIQEHFRACGIETTIPKLDQNRAVCKVGFHSLRHTFVTISKQHGQAAAVVQELCGHSNPMMQKKYTHVGSDATFGAVMSMPSGVFGDPEIPSSQVALPAAVSSSRVHALAERLNGKNWREIRRALLALEGDGRA